MNLRMRSRTEPARWNEGGPLARGVGSRRGKRAVSGWVAQGLPRAWGSGTGNTSVLGWLVGAEHGALAGVGSS